MSPITNKRITAPATAFTISATMPPTRVNPICGKSQPAMKAPGLDGRQLQRLGAKMSLRNVIRSVDQVLDLGLDLPPAMSMRRMMASAGVDLAFNRPSWYLKAPFDGEARDRITIGEEPIQGGVIRFTHCGRMKSRVCSREKARASDASHVSRDKKDDKRWASQASGSRARMAFRNSSMPFRN
jgi:hypothetical protein